MNYHVSNENMAELSFYLQQSKAELFACRDCIRRQCFFLYKHYQFLNKEAATEYPLVAILFLLHSFGCYSCVIKMNRLVVIVLINNETLRFELIINFREFFIASILSFLSFGL